MLFLHIFGVIPNSSSQKSRDALQIVSQVWHKNKENNPATGWLGWLTLLCCQDQDCPTLDGSRWHSALPDCPRWLRYPQMAPNDHMELLLGQVALPARAVALVCYQDCSREPWMVPDGTTRCQFAPDGPDISRWLQMVPDVSR
jgi:hypothetical protein